METAPNREPIADSLSTPALSFASMDPANARRLDLIEPEPPSCVQEVGLRYGAPSWRSPWRRDSLALGYTQDHEDWILSSSSSAPLSDYSISSASAIAPPVPTVDFYVAALPGNIIEDHQNQLEVAGPVGTGWSSHMDLDR